MPTRKTIITAIFVLATFAVGVYLASSVIAARLIAAHQQSTTKELAKWGREYSKIHDGNEAWRAIGMLEYIQKCYVVGPGYRSDPHTEEQLESQRAETIRIISAALDDYIKETADAQASHLKTAKAKILGN